MAHFVRIVAIGHSALNHESQATTRAYVHTIAVKKDKHSNRIARRVRRRRIESSNDSE